MRDVPKWLASLWVLSWLAFAAIALFYPGTFLGMANVTKSVTALVGASAVCVYMFRERLRTFWTALALAIVIVLVYVGELAARVAAYVAIDPEYGLLATLWLKVSTPYAIYFRLAMEGSAPQALVEFYWVAGMPIVQVMLCLALVLNKGNVTRR